MGLKGIFKFTMHGSLKASEGYLRCLERIEQRITDLDVHLKASAKGIRRKKNASTCLGPRGIFKFTMHGSLKAPEGYLRCLERIEQQITDLDVHLKASAKGIRRKNLLPRGWDRETYSSSPCTVI